MVARKQIAAPDKGQPTQFVHSRELRVFRDVDGPAKISRMPWNQATP